MILGELIGLIALPIMWILMIVGIYGMRYELNHYKERPILDFIYAFTFSFSFVCGIALLVWFFIFSGIGVDIGSFVSNLWNMPI